MHFSTFLLSLAAVAPSVAIPTGPQPNGDDVSSLSARTVSPRAPSSKWIPVGKYDVKVKSEIGRGAFAAVYDADTRPSRDSDPVVVKIHRGEPDILPGAMLVRRRVQHWTNVVRVVAGEVYHDVQYLLMDKAGISLETAIQNGWYTQKTANAMLKRHIRGILAGAQAFHDGNLAHNDIHAGNLVFVSGEPKLIDFDLIKSGQFQRSLCGRSDTLGPEASRLVQTRDGIDAFRNDVWAAGVLMINMITGRPAWRQASDPIPMDLWRNPDRDSRSRRIQRHFPQISPEFAYLLANVFTTQDQRYTASKLRTRIGQTENLITSTSRKMQARGDGDQSLDSMDSPENYICGWAPGHNNGTKPIDARSYHF